MANTPANPCPMDLLLQLTPLSQAPAHEAWLGAEERARLALITDKQRAAQFRAGHGLARQLAAELAGGSAPEWRLAITDDGRRELEHPQWGTLSTSLSHSGSWLAVAVGRVRLGIDLELAGRPRDWLALARSVFSPKEIEVLAATADADRESVFLAAWTLKEAWSKRSGRGLQRQEARRCTAIASAGTDAEAWSWRLPEGGALALAASPGTTAVFRGVAGEARPWRFEPSPA